MEAYDEEEDKGTEDASMIVEAPTPDLQAIIARIQALALMVTTLQLVSGGQQTGRQLQGRARQRYAQAIQALEETPCRRPPLEDVERHP